MALQYVASAKYIAAGVLFIMPNKMYTIEFFIAIAITLTIKGLLCLTTALQVVFQTRCHYYGGPV